jgi:hypothetical protein
MNNVSTLELMGYIRAGSNLLGNRNFILTIPKGDHHSGLRMSSINECGRYLYYTLNPPKNYDTPEETVNPRMNRIFTVGHLLESLTLHILKLGGANLTSTQLEFSEFENKFTGHCDAVLNNEYIIEIKSMNDNRFKQFCQVRLKNFDYTYYTQLNCYTHYSKLHKGFLLAINKNNSEYHAELITTDSELIKNVENKVMSILSSKSSCDIKSDYHVMYSNECAGCIFRYKCYMENK